MSTMEYWGTYFRSTATDELDRLAVVHGPGKTYNNNLINDLINDTNTTEGTFRSPWEIDEYKRIFIDTVEFQNNPLLYASSKIYDRLLGYRTKLLDKQFKEKIQEFKQIVVYWHNDYPCIMVQVKERFFWNEKGERKGLYKVIMALFTAIANCIAYQQKIPVELVIRASFGHNIPSVCETYHSFRINIGLVPKYYVTEVLLESLNTLDGIIDEFLNTPLENKTGTTLKLLFRKNSSNKKVSAQITNERKYIELLANYFLREFLDGNSGRFFPVKTMQIIASNINDEGEVCLNNIPDDFHFSVKFQNEEVRQDDVFWDLIEDIKMCLQLNEEQQALCKRSLDFHLSKKKLHGLYSTLEDANLNFIRHSRKSSYEYETGYGSDGDWEFVVPDLYDSKPSTLHFSKMITTSTGMRAINLAIFCSKLLTGPNSNINTKHMYYETEGAIEKVWDIVKALRLERVSYKQSEIWFIDLNHINSTGNHDKSKVELGKIQKNMIECLKGSKNEIIVFDITSARIEKVKEAIKLFSPYVNVILLVSSGMKNEQMGADMNPYGTIRIISTDISKVMGLFEALKTVLSDIERLLRESHDIRTNYKRIGAVLSSKAIYENDIYYRRRELPARNAEAYPKYQLFSHEFEEEMKKIFSVYLTNQNLDELYFLLCVVEQDDVHTWPDAKIKYLSSEDVQKKVIDAESRDRLEVDMRGERFPRITADINKFNRIKKEYDHEYATIETNTANINVDSG